MLSNNPTTNHKPITENFLERNEKHACFKVLKKGICIM